MKRALVVAGLLVGPTIGVAQGTGVVYGTVRDSAGHPLMATVYLVTGTATAYADSGGRYRLVVPAGSVIIRANFVARTPVQAALTVLPGDSVSHDFVLTPTPATVDIGTPIIELGPVVTTAAKRSQLLDEAVTSVAIVSDSEIARRAVNTIDEAVDKAPGVQFLSGQINIRGSSGFVEGVGSRVLLLVDGVPMNQGDRGGINWDVVPVDQVERVEIVKGAGSALYGSAALGGVVNLITRELPLGFHARLRTTAGFFADPPLDVWRFRDFTGGQAGLDLAASYGTPVVRGAFAAGGRHSDGYRQQDTENDWHVMGKSEWRAADHTVVHMTGAWASAEYQVPGAWCLAGHCDDRGQAYQPFMVDRTTNLGAHTTSAKGYLTGTIDRDVSETESWQARASWFRTHFTDYQPSSNDGAVANTFGAEVRGVVRPGAEQVATVGGEASWSDVTGDIFGAHTQSAYAAYGENERSFGRTRLTVGARIDLLSVDGGGMTAVVSPRAGAVLPAGSGTWRVSAGRGFRAPSLAERFVTTTAFGFQVIPNPNLTFEEAWSFEAGYARALGPRLHIDGAAFGTDARHLIEPAFNLSQSQIQFRNLQRARWAGLDVALRAEPFISRLSTSAAYTFLYARELATDSTPERALAFRPRHLVTLSADYTLGAAAVGADFRYSSRMDRVEIPDPSPRNGARVLDLRAEYGRGPLAAHLLVANALNYVYALVPRTLEPVRTVTLTLVYSY
ncbi:MAG TPA: TonB-dependent receptor [Gemmatimonadales bacterium]